MKTIEVGSLPKLPGRANKFAGRAISDAEINQIKEVLTLVESERLREIADRYLKEVSIEGKPDAQQKGKIRALNSAFNIALFEDIGLTYVFDGEAYRAEMYAGIAQKTSGLKKLAWQISFVNNGGDPNIFQPYMYETELGFKKEIIHDAELHSVLGNAKNAVKICVTGAYTMGTWSDAGVLLPHFRKDGLNWIDAWERSQEQIVSEFARNILNPTIKNITKITVGNKKAVRIQIDEPNATKIRPEDTKEKALLRRSLVESIDGVSGVELGLHVCFSHDYRPIAEVISSIPEMRFITLEIANGDPGDLSNYEKQLRPFIDAGYKGQYCIGVLKVHNDTIESAEEIVRRAQFSAELIGDPSRIELAPDCGLRTRILPIAVRKLQEMIKAAQILSKQYPQLVT